MERNEVSGRTVDLSAIHSVKPGWLKPGGGYRLLVQYGRATRHPDFPDVPTARELALNDKARALIEFMETPMLTMGRPYAAPPGVPADRAKALQTAFMAAHRDPAFLAEAAKIGVIVSPVSGEAIVQGIEEMSHASPELYEKVRTLLEVGKKSG
jgi:tripartite-type tricarboxylate transporter receptor subunit TctC